MEELLQKIEEATGFIQQQTEVAPEWGLILGSGLGVLGSEITDAVTIPYNQIPHFPTSTVEGHAGQLVIGTLEGKKVVAMQGRFHYYEGYSIQEVTFPVRVMKALGIDKMLVTNAAGGIDTNYAAGDLMIISDHLNFAFQNPLMGKNEESLGARFPDMSDAYSARLRQLAHSVAEEHATKLQEGVYLWLTGPSYETPAEIRMMRKLGADAVGMSTVPEVLIARHAGIEVLGISCIANLAAGILPQPLSHAEVMEVAEQVKPRFIQLVRGIVAQA
ncbi:purine-nucleoside phosphorylase [Mechercharimyces sp. CAU 1602]|uniref:purine-nucleoside phosphorylase n=1 Tax=Mechercharimyces sp. CAU 1602 TaxID=2973933 RepID=UPI002161FE38|nr:purine-nucleoside phosphorylase [Mechercharimyces sp. CAU 1602]MCS1350836.1 purine-nucleoside phosphorylase [Mechercharimyces sp. CAU 1602]